LVMRGILAGVRRSKFRGIFANATVHTSVAGGVGDRRGGRLSGGRVRPEERVLYGTRVDERVTGDRVAAPGEMILDLGRSELLRKCRQRVVEPPEKEIVVRLVLQAGRILRHLPH